MSNVDADMAYIANYVEFRWDRRYKKFSRYRRDRKEILDKESIW